MRKKPKNNSATCRIIRNARDTLELTQEEFAEKISASNKNINTSQVNICRYEQGTANPPIDIIDACLKIVGYDGKSQLKQTEQSVSTQELSKLMRARLSSKKKSHIRKALYEMVSNVPKD